MARSATGRPTLPSAAWPFFHRAHLSRGRPGDTAVVMVRPPRVAPLQAPRYLIGQCPEEVTVCGPGRGSMSPSLDEGFASALDGVPGSGDPALSFLEGFCSFPRHQLWACAGHPWVAGKQEPLSHEGVRCTGATHHWPFSPGLSSWPLVIDKCSLQALCLPLSSLPVLGPVPGRTAAPWESCWGVGQCVWGPLLTKEPGRAGEGTLDWP